MIQSRTHNCNELRIGNVGERVTLVGWFENMRKVSKNLGFVILRDFYGTTQLVVETEEMMNVMDSINKESTISVEGVVRERSSKNANLPTGEIEVVPDKIEILGKCIYNALPFEINQSKDADENARLKYRYLDLRRPDIQRNLMLRSNVLRVMRDFMANEGFLEIETPILCKSTPEGARDYLVPSRIHHGHFYALPQSPQLFKQLLMASGYDRYFQIARCFRDEDLRADRQPEFTQADMELSFVDIDDVIEVNERLLKHLFKEVINVDVEIPFKRMPWQEAMDRFGSDKPDTRFGMEITDLTDVVKDCGFGVFISAIANGGTVRCITAKNGASTFTRKEIDKLTEYVKGIGVKGLAYIRWVEDAPNCSFGKFLGEGELDKILAAAGAEKGDVVFIIADKKNTALTSLGALRLKCARQLNIIPEGKFNFLWITEFPFFEWNEETQHWDAMHHPFTMPMDECLQYLDTAPEKVFAKAYDLVLNGTELSSGSIRITDYELQQKMFESLGLTDEEIEAKFGFLVEAYKYGAAPHGGMGIGLDRLAMIMCGADSLRDVTAFPKVQNASELMSNCPAAVDKDSLDILGIEVTKSEDE